jgi:ketosteroid isomerase-like protein
MRRTQLYLAAIVSLVLVLCAANASASPQTDREALEKTGAAIRAAFSAGDVATVMKYHHPDVTKALAYNKLLVGRDAVAADLGSTLRQYHLEFVENHVESLLIENGTAVEMTLFTIKSTPIAGGQPSLFRGRTMVVYVRYKESPTGWASIRELIQPATD